MKHNYKKIYNLKELKKKISLERNKGKKVVHCHGVFDLIHVGHIKHLKSAKKEGDFLVVSITSDQFVNKGPGRPVFNQNLRTEVISSLECVDAVIINNFQLPTKLIETIKPDIYFKGPDYKKAAKDKTKDIAKDIKSVKKVGGKIIFSNDLAFSSSNLINNHFNLLNPFQKSFIKNISKKYDFDFISKEIEKIKDLKVFLIGETIIDQYIFGQSLGKSGKEPHLVMQQESIEQYLGGAGAIANHLSTFCKKINFLTMVGKNKNFLSFIKKSLKKNVIGKYLFKKESPTILKTRFIDKITANKLLGVYEINDKKLDKNLEKKLQDFIKKISKTSDLILISDYGHGFISSKIANILLSQKKFVSLNAQVNASNNGYHSLGKYKKINTLIINENELRHEMRDKTSNFEILAQALAKNYNIKNLVVTRGKNGAFMLKDKIKSFYCPAFANSVLDKVGAGDAMLAIISLCLKTKMPDDLALFLGSLAGATAVEHIGNSKFINKNELLRQAEHLIK
jgi:rfaE bifunctional protein kinase chain/domain/rfaE bifunctional protein nucleotidyltransferase chain/domain